MIALDIDESRRNTAKAFGADAVIDPRDGCVAEAIHEITGGKGASVALETSGAASANQGALDSVSPWGTVYLVGIGSEFSFSLAKYLRTQLRILTSWTMSIQGQRACADFVVDHGINLDALFTNRWRLDQAEEAYHAFNRQNSGKGVFLM